MYEHGEQLGLAFDFIALSSEVASEEQSARLHTLLHFCASHHIGLRTVQAEMEEDELGPIRAFSEKKKIIVPDGCILSPNTPSYQLFTETVLQWFDSLPSGTWEWIVHPPRPSKRTDADEPTLSQTLHEWKFLQDAKKEHWFEQHGITFVGWR